MHSQLDLKAGWLSCLMILIMGFFFLGCEAKGKTNAMPMEMRVNIVGSKAKKQTITEKITLVGDLKANETVEIRSEIDGQIEDIKFQEGQNVKKDDVLIQIDSRKLSAALDQAEANLKLAETTNERYQSLISTGAVSQQEFEQSAATLKVNQAAVELNKAELRDTTISAPFDGIMGQRLVSVGQFIVKGAALTFIINQDPIKVDVRVPERYLREIKEGQMVETKIAAYPDETFTGEVYFIDPQIDEPTRTALIKAKIVNPEGKLRSGMFANIQLTINQHENAIVIPETALILKGDAVFVFVVQEDQSVQMKEIKVGTRVPGWVEVLDGIWENDVIVVEGFQKLAPGAKVSVKFEGPSEEKKKNH